MAEAVEGYDVHASGDQPVETSSAGDQRCATATAGEQRASLSTVVHVVEHHEQALVSDDATEEGRPIIEVGGQLRRAESQRDQKAAEGVGRRCGGDLSVIAVQVHVQLAVGIGVEHVLRALVREGRLADAAHAGESANGRTGGGIKQPAHHFGELGRPADDAHRVQRQLSGSPDGHVGDRLGARSAPVACELRVEQCRLLGGLKLRTGLDAELLVHQRPHGPVVGQGIGSAPGHHQGLDQGRLKWLVEGMVVADRLDRWQQPPGLMAVTHGLHELGGREPGRHSVRLDRSKQRLHGPRRRDGGSGPDHGQLERPFHDAAVALTGQKRPEFEQVEVVGGDDEAIAAGGRLDVRPGLAIGQVRLEHAPQLADVTVDDVQRRPGRVALPEALDDKVRAHRVAGGEHQQAQQQPSLWRSQLELDAVAPHARSAEQRET